jgi:hypothetical protein
MQCTILYMYAKKEPFFTSFSASPLLESDFWYCCHPLSSPCRGLQASLYAGGSVLESVSGRVMGSVSGRVVGSVSGRVMGSVLERVTESGSLSSQGHLRPCPYCACAHRESCCDRCQSHDATSFWPTCSRPHSRANPGRSQIPVSTGCQSGWRLGCPRPGCRRDGQTPRTGWKEAGRSDEGTNPSSAQ